MTENRGRYTVYIIVTATTFLVALTLNLVPTEEERREQEVKDATTEYLDSLTED